jgi:SAM-dependent methyltransferase
VVVPLPSEHDLLERYQSLAEPCYLDDSSDRMAAFADELDALAALVARPAPSLLDVGCSYGLLLKAAEQRGMAGLGLELSDDAVEHCRRSGLNVRKGGIEQLGAADSFDAIVLWDVLEHLRDPEGTLLDLRDHLSSSGVVSLLVPDRGSLASKLLREWWWSVIDLHLHYPTRKGLDALLRRCGFSPVHVGTHPKRISGALLARWMPLDRMRAVVSRLIPPSRSLTVDPHDQLLVRARKA